MLLLLTLLSQMDEEDRKTAVDKYTAGFSERVRKMRGEKSREEFAALVGVHPNTIGKWERGLSMPDALAIIQIAKASGAGQSIQWLLTGAEEPSDVPAASTEAVERGQFVYVPQFNIRASAGYGAFNDVEQVVAMRPFDVKYIRQELGILHNKMALASVAGVSMEPDLHSGDVVLLDRLDCDVRTEGPHMLRLDGAIFVKIVQRLPGKLQVSSKNSAYQPFDIVPSDDGGLPDDFEILGRVRWAGVTFH